MLTDLVRVDKDPGRKVRIFGFKVHVGMVAFWIVTPLRSERETDISEENIASIFRVEELFLQKFRSTSIGIHGVHFQGYKCLRFTLKNNK
jgi:hypothetical protein